MLQVIEPNPAQAESYRIRVTMSLVRSSLWVDVLDSQVGLINRDHLQVCLCS